ncbi:MAG: helix-turn-helix domain-containing protein [Candidatus Aminicenantaceae bacterium]
MHDKHETAESKDFLSLYLKNKNYTEDLEKGTPDQQNKDKIFTDFWDPVIEDYWFLIQKFPLKELMDKLELTIIISALGKFEGNQRKTAKFLSMKPTTLGEKIKKHNISFRKIPYKG